MKRSRLVAMALALLGLGSAAAVYPIATSGAGAVSRAAESGGVANFAELVGGQITYIFPFLTCPADTSQNLGEFDNLLFARLYTFDDGAKASLNERTSLAYAPTFSDKDTKVTVQLKPYKWSDGEAVDAQDVVFWQNLMTANKKDYCTYVPGYYPDNIVSAKADGPTKVVFTLNHSYSPTWFLYNELSQIVPIPLAWDKTSSTQTSNCAEDESDCVAVYNYLSSQASHLDTYATNPLWKVVDGPWALKSFSVNGTASFVPNRSFSGPDKPHLSQFNEVTFTSTAAEYDALHAGTSIQVGYIPFVDAPAKGAPNPLGSGYQLATWGIWGFGYIPMDEHNPTLGPVFKQTYFRQALEHLLDQTAVVQKLLRGYGSVGSGPIPTDVPDSFLTTSALTRDPFPFDVAKAKSLLVSHGWDVKPSGVTTCGKPGTGMGECGAGIAKGTRLEINLVDASAPPWIGQSMEDLKSVASEVGIKFNLSSQPADTVIGDLTGSKWQMLDWGSPGWTYVPTVYPSGEDLFKTTGSENHSGYSSPELNALITAVITKPGNQHLRAYDSYIRQQVPVLWQPTSAYQISEVATDLHGVVPQDPLDAISPQDWYYTK